MGVVLEPIIIYGFQLKPTVDLEPLSINPEPIPLSKNAPKDGTKPLPTKEEVSDPNSQGAASESESDSENEVGESAIKDEDDDGGWVDDDSEQEGPLSDFEHRPMFPRVDSKPFSRRSLLTTALEEVDSALAPQNATSQSSPAIHRSRKTTPNGPSTGSSPQEDSGLMMRPQASRRKPIIRTASNVHAPAMSPKTPFPTMLTTELSRSLRDNLLLERQQRNATTNAVAKRQQSAVNLPALRRAMTTGDVKGLNTNEQQAQIRSTTFKDNNNSSSTSGQFFSSGPGDYHKSGW